MKKTYVLIFSIASTALVIATLLNHSQNSAPTTQENPSPSPTGTEAPNVQKLSAVPKEDNLVSKPSAPKGRSDEGLKMVMVDQAQLSTNQRNAFQQYIQTADLPHTKIGKRCQYYGKPDVWCLILDPTVANQVFQQISLQPFGSAASIKPVRRLRAPEKN